MAARAIRYNRYPFQGSQGVTQWYPLSPCIFDFVVGTIIRNLVGLVAEN